MVAEVHPPVRGQSQGRMAQAPGQPQGTKQSAVEIVPQQTPDEAKSREKAGQAVGVSGRYVQDAKKIVDEARRAASPGLGSGDAGRPLGT